MRVPYSLGPGTNWVTATAEDDPPLPGTLLSGDRTTTTKYIPGKKAGAIGYSGVQNQRHEYDGAASGGLARAAYHGHQCRTKVFLSRGLGLSHQRYSEATAWLTTLSAIPIRT